MQCGKVPLFYYLFKILGFGSLQRYSVHKGSWLCLIGSSQVPKFWVLVPPRQVLSDFLVLYPSNRALVPWSSLQGPGFWVFTTVFKSWILSIGSLVLGAHYSVVSPGSSLQGPGSSLRFCESWSLSIGSWVLTGPVIVFRYGKNFETWLLLNGNNCSIKQNDRYSPQEGEDIIGC